MTSHPRRPVHLAALALAYLLLHAAGIAVAGSHALAASYGFEIALPLLAFAACCRRAYVSALNGVRVGWLLLSAALLLWSLGMMLSAWEDLTQQVASNVTYFSDFVYFIYGAPILLAISSSAHAQRSAIFLWLDGVQTALAAGLTYVVIFSVVPFVHQAIEPIPVALLVLTYHVENLGLAGGATVRLLAHRSASAERRYYLALALFLWLYAACAGLYNQLTMVSPNGVGLRELLVDCPFLLLAAMALSPAAKDSPASNTDQREPLALFINNFSPIFFTAALLGLGFVVMHQHFYLGMFSVFVALAAYALRSTTLQNRYMRTEHALREARDKLEQLSLTDGLTGVANRRCFDQMLELEWHHAVRSERPLSLLMIDIDYFKSLNDEFGHPYGDACLIKIAHALRSALPRSSDLLARYGGEEFAAILPATDRAGAEAVAAKMQQAVASLMIDNAPSRGGGVTVSIGSAMCIAAHGRNPAALVATSDQALYRAKQNGRNRVEYEPAYAPAEPATQDAL